jgi:hypothetical protein
MAFRGPTSSRLKLTFNNENNEQANNFKFLGCTKIYLEETGTDYNKADEMGRTCNRNGEKRNAYRILAGKPEEKRPLGRPRRRWVDPGMVCTGLIWLRIGASGGLL